MTSLFKINIYSPKKSFSLSSRYVILLSSQMKSPENMFVNINMDFNTDTNVSPNARTNCKIKDIQRLELYIKITILACPSFQMHPIIPVYHPEPRSYNKKAPQYNNKKKHLIIKKHHHIIKKRHYIVQLHHHIKKSNIA